MNNKHFKKLLWCRQNRCAGCASNIRISWQHVAKWSSPVPPVAKELTPEISPPAPLPDVADPVIEKEAVAELRTFKTLSQEQASKMVDLLPKMCAIEVRCSLITLSDACG